MTEPRNHRVLVSVLGKDPKEAIYELAGRTFTTRLAPLALLALGDEPFDEVIALCTTEAANTSLPLLEEGAGTVPVRAIAIPGGASHDEIGRLLDVFTQSVPHESELVVDITHGFRHLSFLTLLGASYASTLGLTELRAAQYAFLETPPKHSRFVDLAPLLELTGFLYAARVLRERGDPQPLADELDRLSNDPTRTLGVVRALASISHAYASALPLELGRHAGLFLRDQLKPLRRELTGRRLPLVDQHLSQVKEALARVELPISPGAGWKRRTPLNAEELERQARLIDELLERRSIGPALTLMEEWVVSWGCLQLGLASRWLDRDARKQAASKLHALVRIETGPLRSTLAAEQRELARFWRRLSEARNSYAHAGMRGDEVDADLQEELRTGWERLKGAPNWSLDVPCRTDAPVLVSAIGLTPGPLYSALRACRIDPVCVVAVCSEPTASSATDALGQARSEAKLVPLVFADPVGGTSEIGRVVRDATRHLLEGSEVLVNLTGGTTLMGLAVERIAREAERLGRPVRRFGLIDRRTREQQLEQPFVPAEPYWLDASCDEAAAEERR